MKRPISVTTIAWFSIVYAVVSLVPKLIVLVDPRAFEFASQLSAAQQAGAARLLPFAVQMTHALIGSAVLLTAGVAMLRGRGWARILLIVWMLSVLVVTLLVLGLSYQWYAKSAVAIIVIALLYRRAASQYFQAHGMDSP